jgi:hypothetical protein
MLLRLWRAHKNLALYTGGVPITHVYGSVFLLIAMSVVFTMIQNLKRANAGQCSVSSFQYEKHRSAQPAIQTQKQASCDASRRVATLRRKVSAFSIAL